MRTMSRVGISARLGFLLAATIAIARLTPIFTQTPAPEGIVPDEILVQFHEGRRAGNLAAFSQEFGVDVAKEFARRPDLVLVRRQGANQATIDAMLRNPNCPIRPVQLPVSACHH